MKPSPHGGLDWTSGNHARRLPFPFPLTEICENETLHFVSSHQLGSCGPSPSPFPSLSSATVKLAGDCFATNTPIWERQKNCISYFPFQVPFCGLSCVIRAIVSPPKKKGRISVVSSGGESSVGLKFFFHPLDQASKQARANTFSSVSFSASSYPAHAQIDGGKRKSANTSFPSARKKSASRIRIFRTLSAKVEKFLFALSVCGKTPSSHFFPATVAVWHFRPFSARYKCIFL